MTQVRCPACRTVFRAQTAQLQSHGGMVRCGQCFTAFNALAHRVHTAAASTRTTTTADKPPATPEIQHPPREAESTTPPETTDTERTPPRPPNAEPAALRSNRRPITPQTNSGQHNVISPSTSFVATNTPTDSTPPRAPETYSAAHAAQNVLPGDDFETRLAELHQRKQREEIDDEEAATPPAEPVPQTASESPDETTASPLRRSLWGLAIGLLMGALVFQSLYLFRDPLTRQWPQTRPLFLAACEQLGCDMPLPRQAEHIVIESSGLESVSETPLLYVLHARLKNLAPYAQALPHLELTLTGADGKAVTRRSLSPEQWLSPERENAPEEGFQGESSITVQLPFAATDITNAQGYRLDVFYP